MRYLFLDDMDTRHDRFKLQTKGHDVDHVYTVEEAIVALSTDVKYDIVFLDHDLSDIHYVEKTFSSGTGHEVAVFISTMQKDKLPRQVIIHSWNIAGAERMWSVLNNVVPTTRSPF